MSIVVKQHRFLVIPQHIVNNSPFHNTYQNGVVAFYRAIPQIIGFCFPKSATPDSLLLNFF